MLDKDEIVLEIRIPEFSGKSSFVKFAQRKTIDFPIVNCAASALNGEYKICLNAVAGMPKRVTAAEELLKGKELSDELILEAGEAAGIGAKPMKQNKYKISIAKALVKRALIACQP